MDNSLQPGWLSKDQVIWLRWVCRILLLAALIIISWLALTPSPPEAVNILAWDKANHALAFFVLSALSFYSLATGEWRGWLMLLIYGIGIEVTQWYFGFRYFELFDIAADLFGIVLCILCQPLLIRLPILSELKREHIPHANA